MCEEAKADTAKCTATVNGAEVDLNTLEDDDDNIRKLVLRRKADKVTWTVDCRRFATVELSSLDGGRPGARSLGADGDERGRLLRGGDVGSLSDQEIEVHPDIQTPTVQSKSLLLYSLSTFLKHFPI